MIQNNNHKKKNLKEIFQTLANKKKITSKKKKNFPFRKCFIHSHFEYKKKLLSFSQKYEKMGRTFRSNLFFVAVYFVNKILKNYINYAKIKKKNL